MVVVRHNKQLRVAKTDMLMVVYYMSVPYVRTFAKETDGYGGGKAAICRLIRSPKETHVNTCFTLFPTTHTHTQSSRYKQNYTIYHTYRAGEVFLYQVIAQRKVMYEPVGEVPTRGELCS